jgi:four helix bundle protein
MNCKSFEDLKVWTDSRELVQFIHKLTNADLIKKDYIFKDQIRRAAISVMNNIAEGFERNNNKDFIKFLLYSKASAGEVRSMVYIALDLGYITNEQLLCAVNKCLSLSKQLSNFIRYLKTYSLDK